MWSNHKDHTCNNKNKHFASRQFNTFPSKPLPLFLLPDVPLIYRTEPTKMHFLAKYNTFTLKIQISNRIWVWRLHTVFWDRALCNLVIRRIICKSEKVKQSRYTPWRRLGERYSSYSFTTSALYGDEWSASRPGRALPPEKGLPVPTGQEAGPQSRPGQRG
jgi:hypothetical protein